MADPSGSGEKGLIFAYRLDGRGGGHRAGAEALQAIPQSGAVLWIHLNYRDPDAIDWIHRQSGLSALVADALIDETSRPRLLTAGNAVLLDLRGLNFNPGSELDDMLSVRLWTDGTRVISCSKARLKAVRDVGSALDRSVGPCDCGGLVGMLATQTVAHMDEVIHHLERRTHESGHADDSIPKDQLVGALAHLRRSMIRIRRYLGPQRKALVRLAAARVDWLTQDERDSLREVADQTSAYIEGLDAAGEIAEITQDELLQRSSEKTERRLYILSIITTIFLPLTFITGLLGVNVAGIPDAKDPLAFLLLCAFLVALSTVIWGIFRGKRWV